MGMRDVEHGAPQWPGLAVSSAEDPTLNFSRSTPHCLPPRSLLFRRIASLPLISPYRFAPSYSAVSFRSLLFRRIASLPLIPPYHFAPSYSAVSLRSLLFRRIISLPLISPYRVAPLPTLTRNAHSFRAAPHPTLPLLHLYPSSYKPAFLEGDPNPSTRSRSLSLYSQPILIPTRRPSSRLCGGRSLCPSCVGASDPGSLTKSTGSPTCESW